MKGLPFPAQLNVQPSGKAMGAILAGEEGEKKNNPKENMKTEFEEINEIVGDYKYGFKTEAERVIDISKGLNEEIVCKISAMGT